MVLKAELELALDLARRAGALALSMQDNLSVAHKAHGLGPVSNADLAIDKLICLEIAKLFPDDLIISEESFEGQNVCSKNKRVWFIDPIDGTSSYILGRKDFVIMIGLAILGQARLGVIFQPAFDIMWWGINEDCTQNAQEIRNNTVTCAIIAPGPKLSLDTNFNLIVSRTSRSRKASALIDLINPTKLVHSSSFGLKTMMVMTGQADLYVCWARHIHMWDTCAPRAIMAAAGATLSFLDGEALLYEGSITHKGAIMAARYEPEATLRAALIDIDEQKYVA